MRQMRLVGTLFAAAVLLAAVGLLLAGAFALGGSAVVLSAAGGALCALSVLFLLYAWVFSPRSFDVPLERLSAGDMPQACPAELEGVRSRLCAQREQLDHRVRDLKTLNSYISHEVKNSLNVLTAKVELKEPREKLLEYLKRMAVTVEDILILSEVSSEQTKETTDLAMVCALAVDDYSKSRSSITFELPTEGVDEVAGREHLYYRAVSNLIDNAVKYGGDAPISLKLYQEQGCVVLRVENSGAPLSADNFANIFDTNYRLSSLKKNSYGIGLSLVKNVAELGGGTVWAENGPMGETLFYLSLPVWKGGEGR